MKIEDISIVRRRHRDGLHQKPNVVGTAIGRKTTGGRQTGETGVVVFVQRKRQSRELSPEDMIPSRIDGVVTDVREATFRARWSSTAKHRPAPGGVSIGHQAITAGTLGGKVLDLVTGRRALLSNNHILANCNDCYPGDAILQPGPYDYGTMADRIGYLERYVPIWFDGRPNVVDAAIALPLYDAYLDDDIYGLGEPGSPVEAEIEMQLWKRGRTTGLSFLTVSFLDADIWVNYGVMRQAWFEQQVIAEGALGSLLGGDSGSILMERDTCRPVALAFAGNVGGTMAVANPIGQVLSDLDLEFPVILHRARLYLSYALELTSVYHSPIERQVTSVESPDKVWIKNTGSGRGTLFHKGGTYQLSHTGVHKDGSWGYVRFSVLSSSDGVSWDGTIVSEEFVGSQEVQPFGSGIVVDSDLVRHALFHGHNGVLYYYRDSGSGWDLVDWVSSEDSAPVAITIRADDIIVAVTMSGKQGSDDNPRVLSRYPASEDWQIKSIGPLRSDWACLDVSAIDNTAYAICLTHTGLVRLSRMGQSSAGIYSTFLEDADEALSVSLLALSAGTHSHGELYNGGEWMALAAARRGSTYYVIQVSGTVDTSGDVSESSILVESEHPVLDVSLSRDQLGRLHYVWLQDVDGVKYAWHKYKEPSGDWATKVRLFGDQVDRVSLLHHLGDEADGFYIACQKGEEAITFGQSDDFIPEGAVAADVRLKTTNQGTMATTGKVVERLVDAIGTDAILRGRTVTLDTVLTDSTPAGVAALGGGTLSMGNLLVILATSGQEPKEALPLDDFSVDVFRVTKADLAKVHLVAGAPMSLEIGGGQYGYLMGEHDLSTYYYSAVVTYSGSVSLDRVVWHVLFDADVSSRVSQGPGAISWTAPQVVDQETGLPIADAACWITTDEAGLNVIAGTLTADAFGFVTFRLQPGKYWFWAHKNGYNITSPTEVEVS